MRFGKMGASPNPLQRRFATNPSISIAVFLVVAFAWLPIVGVVNDAFLVLVSVWLVVPVLAGIGHWALSRLSFEERFDWGVPYAWWSPRLPGYREPEDLLEAEQQRRSSS